MKRTISCLLVVMMLFTALCAFAEASELGRFRESNILKRFVRETDFQTKDIALQVQSGDKESNLVIRVDGDNLHLVARNGDVEDGHIQLNSTGIYLDSADKVTLLPYATITTVMQDIVNAVDSMLEEAVQSIPEEALPSETEVKEALDKLGILASAVEAQEQADAATVSSAALAFVNKFKPGDILDVKEEPGSIQISLRSDAYATALVKAMDELMSNPDLAELVDRRAAQDDGKNFAKYQKQWKANREATLAAIRSIESTQTIDENGHSVSHFQIGEALSETKILMCDTDSWIDVENGKADITVILGFKNEAPLMVYEFAVNPNYYWEKLTAGDSMTEILLDYDDGEISRGQVTVVLEGKEELMASFGPNYLYMKGPKGGISTSVRETWTGKIRYELFAETAEGEESSLILDFYQEDDSLVCELYTGESDQSVMFKISRIDKVDIKDLSASENINEITVEKVNAELEPLLKMFAKTDK